MRRRLEVITDGITKPTVVYTEELIHGTDSNQDEIMDSNINLTWCDSMEGNSSTVNLGLEYLHLFYLDISIRKMGIFQLGKKLSNVKFANKCVGELTTYHGNYCTTLNNDQNVNYYNANNENNINVKNYKGLDQVPDSREADLKRLFNPAIVVEVTVPKQTSKQ
ncbi:hypothetical protein TNCV_1716551 [Trichonephila clavipes]|nr:hypothetical protein TNCV_1716551 [Trichonephila clavipes]